MTGDAPGPRTRIGAAAVLAELARFDTVVDVRSPSEFADDHLPGALNCPVLDDAERALIGTLHAQDSPFAARRRGAVLVARNVATLIERRFVDKPRDWRPLVYCWRGGERSAALAHVLQRVGWRALQLDGGYRAYRRAVLAELDVLPAQYAYRVICGPTGSGKSRLLRALAASGAQVLDLEDLACHRGSVLGGLPQAPQPSQKRFESALWWALRGLDPARPVYVESESRKIGDLRVPTALIERMRDSPCLRLELPLAQRVRLLREEYGHFQRDPSELAVQLDCLRPLYGHERIGEWKARAEAGDWDGLVEQLLVQHYDPAYRRSIDRNYALASQAEVLAFARAEAALYASAAADLAARG